jgi:hypothetical protein
MSLWPRLSACVIFLLHVMLFCACSGEKVPGGRIVVRNDIMDKEYNSFVVDKVISSRGMTPFSKTLNPGEESLIPFSNIISMRFTRRYEDFSRVYVVRCPRDADTAVTMKLIDVHTNRLAGGCVLEKRGVLNRAGIMKWD